MYTVCYVSERVCAIQSTVEILKKRSGYWSGNRTPILVAIGPAIGHVRTCHSRGAKVTVSVVSTTVRLTVERSIHLATVGITMMEASLVWPDSFAAVSLRKTRWSLGNDDCIETP